MTYMWNIGGSTSTTNVNSTTSQALTASTTYTVQLTNAYGCVGAVSAPAAITVNPVPTITLSSGDASQAVIHGMAMTTIIYTASDDATISMTGSLPQGVTGAPNGSSYTISGTPAGTFGYAFTGTFGYALTAAVNGCTGAAAGTITVVPTTLCEQCCYDGATWVDCHVTTNAVTAVKWISSNNENYFDGARSDRNGRANFTAITSSSVTIAATGAVGICKSLGPGWYLPAYEELYAMSSGAANTASNNLAGAGIITVNFHWSSTEYYDNGGRYSSNNTGYQIRTVNVSPLGPLSHHLKIANLSVRCAWRE
jgi:hypothetical protein